MKRFVPTILGLLLLGAIVNAAVAWASEAWMPSDLANAGQELGAAEVDDLLNCYAPAMSHFERYKSATANSWGSRLTYTLVYEKHYSVFPYFCDDRGNYIPTGELVVVMEACLGMPLQTCRYGAVSRVTAQTLAAPTSETRFTVVWPGFAINTVFYALVLWLLVARLFALRRRRRIKRGLCPKCAYDLRGTPQGATACPECGATVTVE